MGAMAYRQRHLSCIETGRARTSREMLHALLDALDAPLAERNDTLLAAGYAPAYTRRTLADAELAPAPKRATSPLLETALRTLDGGVLRFFSVFTTFGAPLDVTVASLRVEHFFPVDEATRPRMAHAVAELPA